MLALRANVHLFKYLQNNTVWFAFYSGQTWRNRLFHFQSYIRFVKKKSKFLLFFIK